MQNQLDIPRDFLKKLSVQDFRTFGMHQLAYVRSVRISDDRIAYAIHAADGTPLSILETLDMAVSVTLQNDLHPVTVH